VHRSRHTRYGSQHVTTFASSQSPSTTAQFDPNSLIDDYATNRIDYQVWRIGQALRLSHHRREDLRQDLFTDLCEAARRYDPTKSSPRTFVSRVVAQSAAHHGRCIRNERKYRARSPILLSQLQRDCNGFAPRAPRWCEPSAHDLTLDLPRGIAAMSRSHQQLAESLKTQSPADIAAERDVHRSTVYRDIASIRGTLSEFGLDPRR